MHHHIVDQAHRQFDQLHIQPHRTMRGTAAPLGLRLRQFDGARHGVQQRRVMFHAPREKLFGFVLVPVRYGLFYVCRIVVVGYKHPQHLAAQMCRGGKQPRHHAQLQQFTEEIDLLAIPPAECRRFAGLPSIQLFHHPARLVLQHAAQPFLRCAQWHTDSQAAIVDAQTNAAAFAAAFQRVSDVLAGEKGGTLFNCGRDD